MPKHTVITETVDQAAARIKKECAAEFIWPWQATAVVLIAAIYAVIQYI